VHKPVHKQCRYSGFRKKPEITTRLLDALTKIEGGETSLNRDFKEASGIVYASEFRFHARISRSSP